MVSHRRRTGRAIAAVLAVFALTGGAAGLAAAPANATPVPPVLPGPSTSAGTLSPGLYVQVVDGQIHVSNGGSQLNFAAGQFGFVPTITTPPVIIPQNPGIVFAPPPVFQTPPALTAAQQAAAQAAAASATARQLAAAADAAQAAVTAARAHADDLAAKRDAAAGARDDAEAAKGLADQGVPYAQQQLADAEAALQAIPGDGPDHDAALAAYTAAQAALASAQQQVTATGDALESAIAAATAAASASDAAEQAVTTASVALETAQHDAAVATTTAVDVVAATTPAVPPTLPTPTESASPSKGDDPTTVKAGQTLLLLASGFRPGTQTAFGVYSDPLAVAPVSVDPQGFAAASFQIPATFTGAHSLVAVGVGMDGLQRILRLDITVTAPAATPAAVPAVASTSTTSLAATGVDATVPALLGGGMLLVGVALAVLSTRRRRVA